MPYWGSLTSFSSPYAGVVLPANAGVQQMGGNCVAGAALFFVNNKTQNTSHK